MVTKRIGRIGTSPTPGTPGDRAHGAPPRARVSRRRPVGRAATLAVLVALSVASVVATLVPDVLAWSPDLPAWHRDTGLALVVLAVAVAVELLLTAVSVLRHRETGWALGLLTLAALLAIFWLAPPTSRLFVLYVATVGLALWTVSDADPAETHR